MPQILYFLYHLLHWIELCTVQHILLNSKNECLSIHLDNVYHVTAHQADYFIVGLTNNPPSTSNPTVLNYTVCGQWPAVAFPGQPMFVQCPTSSMTFRYVLIVGNSPGYQLTVCELQVYGKGQCSQSLMFVVIKQDDVFLFVSIRYCSWYSQRIYQYSYFIVKCNFLVAIECP